MQDAVPVTIAAPEVPVGEVLGEARALAAAGDANAQNYLLQIETAQRRVQELEDPDARAAYIAERENNPDYFSISIGGVQSRPDAESAARGIGRPSRADVLEMLAKDLQAARQALTSATNNFRSYSSTTRSTGAAAAQATRAETDAARLDEQIRRNQVVEGQATAAQQAANEIAQGRLGVDRATQALNERKFTLDTTLAELQNEGRLDERALNWAKFEYDKVNNEALSAERNLARLEARFQFGEEQARAERTSQVAQRGQDIEAASGLGRGAQEAALGTFMGTVPEGTTEFFNKALMGMGNFYPGGPSAIPQLRQAPSVQVPTDLTQVGTRVASAVMGGQVPGVLPPRISAPAPLVGQAGAFNGAAPVVDEEAAAAAQEAAQAAMQELMADEGPGPMEEPEEEEPEAMRRGLGWFRGY